MAEAGSSGPARIAFFGTPPFAVPALRACQGVGTVVAVVTQPDRPRGRGQQLAPPPVKECALRFGLPVYQPERVRRPEAVEYLRGRGAEAMWWWGTVRSFRKT